MNDFSLVETGEPELFEGEEQERDEYAELFSGLEEAENEKVLLYRIKPGSIKQGLLCKLEPGTPLEDIPARFGGGDYIIKRLHGGRILRSTKIFVEGEPKGQPGSLEKNSDPSGSLDVKDLFQAMQENNKQLLLGMAQIFGTGQQQQTSKQSLIEELTMMKQFFSGGEQKIDPLAGVLKGIELAKSLVPATNPGEANGTDVLLEAIKSFAPVAAKAMENAALQQRQPQPQQQQQQQQITDTTATATTPDESENEMIFKYYVGLLAGYAAAEKDAVLYADVIADNLEDSQIMELLDKPDLIEYLKTFNPEVETHRVWFEALIAELRVIMDLTEKPEDTSVAAIDTEKPDENATTGNHNKNAT